MTMNIGGKTFKVCKGKYTPEPGYWRLCDAYDKPSNAKLKIWEDWNDWHRWNSENQYDYITIRSRNCFRFSINGQITVDGKEYTFLITSTRQELYER